jgi:hypothetical protein
VRHLVELSPRVAGSPGGYQAQGWVLTQLKRQGWNATMRVGPTPGSGFVMACQPGKGPAFWILAHTDAVSSKGPGAIDNAGSVAVALQVAAKVRRANLPVRACFAFPDGEELGFFGSRLLARTLGESEKPAFVVALEFLGQGELTAMGIGEKWGSSGLAWIVKVGGIQVPFAYRVYASLFPSLERADHKPFVELGVQSMLLMGRGPHGVYWPYHTVRDDLDQVDSDALAEAIKVLLAMLQRGPPLAGSGPALSVPWLPLIIPGSLVWLGIGFGIVCGFLVGFSNWRTAIGGLGWAALGGFFAGAAVIATGFGHPLHGAMAGLSHWVWLLCFFGVILLSPLKEDGVKAGALVCAWLAVGFCAIHPLLAFPWAMMALVLTISTRFWPLLFLVLPFPFFVVSADLWRELVFHGVLPPDPLWWMPVKIIALWPVSCVVLAMRPLRDRNTYVFLSLVILVLGCLLFLSEPFSGYFFEREVLYPSR